MLRRKDHAIKSKMNKFSRSRMSWRITKRIKLHGYASNKWTQKTPRGRCQVGVKEEDTNGED